MQGIYLLIGGNLGNREDNLEASRIAISEKIGEILNQSSIYETQAWGETDQPDFLNQVLKVETSLNPEELLQATQEIEQQLGKVKVGKWRERLIDIDILYYHGVILHSDSLTIPHPQIQNRNFTLAPLVELIPEEIHPVLLLSQKALLAQSPDILAVWKYRA